MVRVFCCPTLQALHLVWSQTGHLSGELAEWLAVPHSEQIQVSLVDMLTGGMFRGGGESRLH